MRRSIKLILFLFIITLPLVACGKFSEDFKQNNTAMDIQMNLLEAVAKQNIQMVRIILESKPDLERSDSSGRTPLMLAVYNEDVDISSLLIKAGADVNAQDDILNSPFLYAGANGNLNILKMCLFNNADFDVYNRYGGTALIPAAERGHLEIVKELVNIPNYPIDHINRLGWTALLEAVILTKPGKTQEDIITVLINAGCDVNIADKDGVSPLKHAENKSLERVARLLREAGAD